LLVSVTIILSLHASIWLFCLLILPRGAICVGCMIYKAIIQKDPEHCPGGVCEVRQKEPVQKFNPIQAIIAITTATALFVGIYLFLAKTESKTFFGEFLHEAVLSKEALQKEEELKYQREMEKEFGADDF